ncbi:hypothetical protein POM88_028299 [Heracleum sosnowskyi]|uniref:DUF6598 domain-containing protein n=1 Tax=Heracleum sosnowskyi TaxID=360622 RepID=A0AAD8MM63_9APIA|nr:hypothetical protein POM88_028299 [Heracleum sosnowskyi]
MLEIFGIIYLGKDDIEPQNQLGRIHMYAPDGIFDIYNVDKVDETRKTIRHGDEFDMKDIKGPVPFEIECNSLDFDLFCGAYKGFVYNFFTEWRFLSNRQASLAKIRLNNSLDGTGEIAVLMGMYAHATIADVEVRVNSSDSSNVYGHVAASNNYLDVPMTTSMLFLNKDDKGIPVGNDGLVPLSRSLVAVPSESVLYLDISLVVAGQNISTTLIFPARKTGVTKPKEYKNLSVTVKWNALYYDSNKEEKKPDTMDLDRGLPGTPSYQQ